MSSGDHMGGQGGLDLRAPVVHVDVLGERPGWAAIALVGPFASPVACRILGGALIDLFGEGVDTVSLDARRCTALAPSACHVLVDAARFTRLAGGCLVASGFRTRERLALRSYDVDHRLDLSRDRPSIGRR